MSCFVDIMLADCPDSFCVILINLGKETFKNKDVTQKTLFSLEERFKPMYECLFGYNDSAKVVKILGDMIYADDKKFIMEVMSLMRANRNLKGGNDGSN